MRFSAQLQSANESGRWVLVPDEVAAGFATRRPAVRGTVNGVPFRSRLAVYGGRSYLGFTAPIRSEAGIELGDVLDIWMEPDEEPREVDIPAELQSALDSSPPASAAFESLAFTHRKEYATWIAEAKRDETRQRRASKAIEMLVAGASTPR
jgi:hypothetical protein